jgi:hypothetical protein
MVEKPEEGLVTGADVRFLYGEGDRSPAADCCLFANCPELSLACSRFFRFARV